MCYLDGCKYKRIIVSSQTLFCKHIFQTNELYTWFACLLKTKPPYYIYIYIRLFKYAIKFHVCGEPLLRWNLQWIMRWQINLLINLQGCCCLQKGLCIFLLRWLIHCFVVCCKSLSFSVSLSHTLSLSLSLYLLLLYCDVLSVCLSVSFPLHPSVSLSLSTVRPSVRPSGRL